MHIRTSMIAAIMCLLLLGCGRSQEYKDAYAALNEIHAGFSSRIRMYQVENLLRKARMNLDRMEDPGELETLYRIYNNIYQYETFDTFTIAEDPTVCEEAFVLARPLIREERAKKLAADIEKHSKHMREVDEWSGYDLDDIYKGSLRPTMIVRASSLLRKNKP